MLKLYRDMEEAEDGKPVIGYVSKHLGVRIRNVTVGDEDVFDIEVDDNGDTHPGTGGISVTPPCVKQNIKRFSISRLIKKKTILWEIDASTLADFGLKYRQDPEDTSHGFIEPANKMAARELVSRVKKTRDFWSKSNDLHL
ncbi:hypothetical protein EFU43_17170 [Vibrio cholerae]|nr:hypothetical protein [Vibrio cholerae]